LRLWAHNCSQRADALTWESGDLVGCPRPTEERPSLVECVQLRFRTRSVSTGAPPMLYGRPGKIGRSRGHGPGARRGCRRSVERRREGPRASGCGMAGSCSHHRTTSRVSSSATSNGRLNLSGGWPYGRSPTSWGKLLPSHRSPRDGADTAAPGKAGCSAYSSESRRFLSFICNRNCTGERRAIDPIRPRRNGRCR
jgi:hypothetical protein